MSQSVLVVGGGELGTAILEAMSRHPARRGGQMAVLLRPETIDSENALKKKSNSHLKSLGAELVPGNFVSDTVSDLTGIFKNYDVVIQAGGYGLPAGTQLKSTRAALKAGVKRYFPWQFGVDYEAIGEGSSQELFDEMLKVRRLLRAQSGTSWTIISTGVFMSYLFLSDFEVVDFRHKTVHALGSWDNKVTVTTPQDIGTMTAEMVYVPGDTGDRVVYIGGDTISYGRLADLMDAAYDTEFTRETWEMAFLRKRLRENPTNLWYKYQNIFGEGTGVSWDIGRTLNGQRHILLTAVERYIQKHKTNWVLGAM